MSETINDGGPAFPISLSADGPFGGLTKREHFAGLALMGMGNWSPARQVGLGTTNSPLRDLTPSEVHAVRAEWAVAQADALIAALATRKTEGA